MKSLLWKELRENAGWAAILFAGVALALGVWADELPWGRIDESITSDEVLGILLIAAPLGALALGLLQTLPEIQRDAWAFLVHRPVSPTRIFLAKTIVGTGLYIAALLVPFLLLALWVERGAPERRVFHPFMLWPGVAIVLASAGLHGAAMLVALRRARWLGTRLLPLALPAGALTLSLTYIFNVSEMPSPGLLLFILAAHVVTTLAAWGAFVRGGEATGQPLAARVALGLSLWLAALSILGGLLGLGIGVVSELMPPRTSFDRRDTFEGLVAETEEWNALLLPLTFHEIHTSGWPGRERVAHWIFDHHGAADQWIQSTPDGALHGYREERDSFRRRTFRLVRLAGPDGFREPSEARPRGFGPFVPARWPHRYGLEPAGDRRPSEQVHRKVLACADGIYDVDFAREEVRLLLAAPEGEPIRGASVEETPEGVEVAIATDRSVRFFSTRAEVVGTVTDELTQKHANITTFLPEREIFAATIPAAMRGLASSFSVARVPGRSTCVFLSGRDTRTIAPVRLVETDASGRILRRKDGLDGGRESELARAASIAAATFAPVSVAGAAALADEVLISGDGPGFLRVSAGARPGWTVLLVATLTLQALVCAALAWTTARRHGFPRAKRRLWTGLGALLGPAGLVALAGTRDWSPTPACATCGRRRGVTIAECPYCGRALDPPARDGTEVIETSCTEPSGIESRSIP